MAQGLVVDISAPTGKLKSDLSTAKGEVGSFSQAGGKMGNAFKAGAAVGVAAIGTLIAKGVDAAKQMDEANSTIQRGTGRSGESLKALQKEAKGVFESTNASYDEVANTIATVDTLFDGTAEQVGALTFELESYSDVVGGDMATNSEKLGQVAAIFGEDIEGASASLDTFTAVSQDYGIGGDALLANLQKQGPTWAALGLNMDETAIAFGKMTAAGINIKPLTAGMEKFIGTAVEAGKDPKVALEELNAAISGATSEAEALAIAQAELGDKAGIQYVNALNQGIDVTGDFGAEIEATGGRLETMAAESETFGEKFTRLQNSIQGALGTAFMPIMEALLPLFTALTPVIEAVAPVIGQVVKGLADSLVPIINTLISILEPILQPILIAIEGAFAILVPIIEKVVSKFGQFLIPIIEMLMPHLSTLIEALTDSLMPILDALWPVIEIALEPALKLLQIALEALDPILGVLIEVISTVLELIGGAVGTGLTWYVENLLTPALEFVMPVFDKLSEGVQWLSDKVSGLIGWFADLIAKVGSIDFGAVWDKVKTTFKDMVNWVIDKWNAIDFGFSFTVPDIWGVPNRGETFGIEDIFPDIPRLASGGIVTDPTLALVGEEGPEAVIPLDQAPSVTGGTSINIENLYVQMEGVNDPMEWWKNMEIAIIEINKRQPGLFARYAKAT